MNNICFMSFSFPIRGILTVFCFLVRIRLTFRPLQESHGPLRVIKKENIDCASTNVHSFHVTALYERVTVRSANKNASEGIVSLESGVMMRC